MSLIQHTYRTQRVRLLVCYRLQMLAGARKFDVGYDGDPDLQPIRSYECAFLVRAMHDLSTFINSKVRFLDHDVQCPPPPIHRLIVFHSGDHSA